jgi:hypothetical protein
MKILKFFKHFLGFAQEGGFLKALGLRNGKFWSFGKIR